MTFRYDSGVDVLYLVFEPTAEPCGYVENESGDILRISKTTHRVVGCTIPFFSARMEKGPIEIPGIGAIPGDDEDLARLGV